MIGLRASVFRAKFTSSICAVKMLSSICYEDAVQKLNTLQSNKAVIEQIRKDIKTGQKCTNMEDMERYLLRTGVSLAKLDTLSVIHVAGTKGKGSTSAMCESILRHHGFKTGFYSSPHLVSVCERIRLDGQVISKDKFAQNFHSIYNMLDSSKLYEGDMPKYFAFLTVMAFNMFLKEEVDVAIIEVGIGGILDYTNIVRKVPVVGITALGLDHTSILGNTIEEIAAAKAGIMKPGCQAYTVSQPENALEVLKRVANEVQCPLNIVPDYKSYQFPNGTVAKLPIDVPAYEMNASHAIQLAHAWMRHSKQDKMSINRKIHLNSINYTNGSGRIINGFNDKSENACVLDVPVETVEGITNCRWPGRYQVIDTEFAHCYLDGAHTQESLDICAEWYTKQAGNKKKVLVFSATGDRDSKALLASLARIHFEKVLFVVPTSFKKTDSKNDNYSTVEQNELIARCRKHADIWKELKKDETQSVTVLESVSDAFQLIEQTHHHSSNPCVLVTGSLHLVGAALFIIGSKMVNN